MRVLATAALVVAGYGLAGCGGGAASGSADDAGAFVPPAGSDGGADVGSEAGGDRSDAAPPDATITGDASLADAAPAVRFIGRVDRSGDAGPRFAWSGSTLVARFTGPTVGVRLADNGNYFAVLVDGTMQAMPLVTTAAQSDYPLAANLSPGPHELRLYRLTEASQGDTQWLGLTLDAAGSLLPAPAASVRRIELVGDSISCGYGDTGMGPNCGFSLDTENHYLSYGAITARDLGAALITTAWSGKGMYRNYGGDMTDTLPVLYLRTLPDQATSAWDFAQYTPDVVVINLGTNDFATGDPGQPYADAYLAFARMVRSRYPGAYIECTNGPMLADPSLSAARGYITGVVSTMTAGGDSRVGYLEYPTQSASNGLGCDYHPSVTTHQLMAAQLTAALKAALGW